MLSDNELIALIKDPNIMKKLSKEPIKPKNITQTVVGKYIFYISSYGLPAIIYVNKVTITPRTIHLEGTQYSISSLSNRFMNMSTMWEINMDENNLYSFEDKNIDLLVQTYNEIIGDKIVDGNRN